MIGIVKSRTAYSLILLGALVIGGAGLWYRVGSDDAAAERQKVLYQDYATVRSDVNRIVEQIDSPEALVDAAATIRDDQRTLDRIIEPAEGELEDRVVLQQKQIATILQLVRANANFSTSEARERSLKRQILQQEATLDKPL